MTFQLLPSGSFEPSVEDIRRFASVIGAAPGLARRALGTAEPTVLRLRKRGTGDTQFLLEVPRRLAERMRETCYRGVEAIEVHEPPAEPSEARAVREMVLRRDAIHALYRVPLSPDPMEPFCLLLDHLDSAEQAEIVVALWPAQGAWRHHLDRKRRSQSPSEVLSAMWHEFKQNRTPPRRPRNIPDKADGVPVFRARVFVRTAAPERRSARALASDLASWFELWHGENSLRRAGPIRLALGPGSLTPRSLGRRLAEGAVPPRRSQFLSLHELAGWLYPPSGSCRGRHLARAEAAPAPSTLPVYRPPHPTGTDPTPPEAA